MRSKHRRWCCERAWQYHADVSVHERSPQAVRRRLVRPSVHVLASFAAMGCLVSFNDYPTGDLRTARGGAPAGGAAAAGSGGLLASAGTESGAGTVATGGSPSAGSGGGAPSAAGSGGASMDCAEVIEICDGLDNDCDDAVDEDDTCPFGCSAATYLDQVYLFCTLPSDFAEAAAQCAASDMTLVRVDSLEENDFLWETMNDLVGEPDMYIGGTDAANEGHWLWPDGTEFWNGDENGMAVDGAFEHWGLGVPNNQSADFQDENCAVLRLDSAEGSWGDRACDEEHAFACEPE